jgi:hypothetical protein
MSKKQHAFKIIFYQRDNIYEIYARQVTESDMYGFIVVEELLFGDASSVVVDPSEEKLKQLFDSVMRTYIPIHAVLRIDEVEKEGLSKITKTKNMGNNISPFPMSHLNPEPPKD